MSRPSGRPAARRCSTWPATAISRRRHGCRWMAPSWRHWPPVIRPGVDPRAEKASTACGGHSPWRAPAPPPFPLEGGRRSHGLVHAPLLRTPSRWAWHARSARLVLPTPSIPRTTSAGPAASRRLLRSRNADSCPGQSSGSRGSAGRLCFVSPPSFSAAGQCLFVFQLRDRAPLRILLGRPEAVAVGQQQHVDVRCRHILPALLQRPLIEGRVGLHAGHVAAGLLEGQLQGGAMLLEVLEGGGDVDDALAGHGSVDAATGGNLRSPAATLP